MPETLRWQKSWRLSGSRPRLQPPSFIFPLLVWLHRSRGSTHLFSPLVWLHKDDCLLVTSPCPASPLPSPPPPHPPFLLLPLFSSSVLSKHQRDLSYPDGLNLLTGNNSRRTSRPLASLSHVTMCSRNDRQGRSYDWVEIFSGGACSASAGP